MPYDGIALILKRQILMTNQFNAFGKCVSIKA